MKNIAFVVLLFLAGCTVYSGPTANMRPVGNGHGDEQVYQVECTGLFEETGSCLSKAQEMCAIQPGSPALHVIEQIAPRGRTPDRLLFRCEVPRMSVPAAVPAPAPAPAPVQSPAKVLLHGDALFDFDKSTLKPAGQRALDRLITDAGGKRFRVVQVSGYTDSIGSESYNNALSMRRARTVATYLREHGLQADRFVVNGLGKSNPVASNATDDGRAQNRRVELVLEQK